MPATRRKTAATSRLRGASREPVDRSGKTSSADMAIEEATTSQPSSVKDICKLRNSGATSRLSTATRPQVSEYSRASLVAPMITGVVRRGVVIVDITSHMRGIMTAAVVVGIIVVDGAWTSRQMNPYAATTTFA